MNTNMQELSRAYRRGVEVGRELERREADEFAALTKAFNENSQGMQVTAGGRTIKFKIGAPTAPKSAKSRAARTNTGPREKGVREKILALITSDVMSPQAIVAATGFKVTSVRATLMSLKKAGLAMNDGGLWQRNGRLVEGNGGTDAEVRV